MLKLARRADNVDLVVKVQVSLFDVQGVEEQQVNEIVQMTLDFEVTVDDSLHEVVDAREVLAKPFNDVFIELFELIFCHLDVLRGLFLSPLPAAREPSTQRVPVGAARQRTNRPYDPGSHMTRGRLLTCEAARP
jgi:hypothetical protein